MTHNGGLEESEFFGKIFNYNYNLCKYGCLQSIGYKELWPYNKLQKGNLPEYYNNIVEIDNLFNSCIKNLQNHTKQYARRQLRYIKNRLLER